MILVFIIYCDSLIEFSYWIKIWILTLSLLIILMVLFGSVRRELFSGGFVVDFVLKMPFLDSPWAAESSKLIGSLDGDREELTAEFSFYRPF